MVLEQAAEQLGLPKAAAHWLRMEFVRSIMAHDQTMQAAGLCDGAKFAVLDKEMAEAKVQEAKGVDLLESAKSGQVDGVEVYCILYPEKMAATIDVSVATFPLFCCC